MRLPTWALAVSLVVLVGITVLVGTSRYVMRDRCVDSGGTPVQEVPSGRIACVDPGAVRP